MLRGCFALTVNSLACVVFWPWLLSHGQHTVPCPEKLDAQTVGTQEKKKNERARKQNKTLKTTNISFERAKKTSQLTVSAYQLETEKMELRLTGALRMEHH